MAPSSPRIIISASHGQCGLQTHLCSSLWEGASTLGDFHGPVNFHFYFGLSKTVGINFTEGINFPAPVPSLGLKRHHKFPSDPLELLTSAMRRTCPKVTTVSEPLCGNKTCGADLNLT